MTVRLLCGALPSGEDLVYQPQAHLSSRISAHPVLSGTITYNIHLVLGRYTASSLGYSGIQHAIKSSRERFFLPIIEDLLGDHSFTEPDSIALEHTDPVKPTITCIWHNQQVRMCLAQMLPSADNESAYRATPGRG